MGANPARSTSGLTTSAAWLLRGRTSYCVDGQVYTAASAVRWAIDLGLVPAADQLDTVAADSSDGVLCVPALAGLAAPWWDSAATASFTGMRLSSGRGQLVRALLEGIAAQVAALADLVATDLGQPLTRLRVDGGLTRSAVLMQAQADLARIPVDVYPSLHATALGAAACARLALDPSLDVTEAVGRWKPQHTYEPEWPAYRAAEYLARWARAAKQFWHRGRQRLHERHPRRQRRLRRRSGRWRHRGLRDRPHTRRNQPVGDPARSARRRRRRHQQGQYRIAAHRVRCIAGNAGVAAVARGYYLLGDYAQQTGIPVERTGAMLVAWTEEERDALPGLKDKAERNGYHECEIVTADDVYRRVPDLGPGALAGLTVPGESIICTWTTNLALATDAVSAALDCCAARVSRVPPSATNTPRYAPPAEMCTAAGSSTPRVWALITSTPNSAITGSPSRRDAVNFWCSTSLPGRWCR